MLFSEITAPDRLNRDQVHATLQTALSGRFRGQKVLVLVPDHTRSCPLPLLFRELCEVLSDTRQTDFMVALGTHPPLDEAALLSLFGITASERSGPFKRFGFFNHVWDDPAGLTTLGWLEQDEIRQLAGADWHPSLPERIQIQINRKAIEYDQILILGPTFPHEVVGMSGGKKYLFPGISGAEMINATHWLGALAGVKGTIGYAQTPVRAMIHAAAERLPTPITLAALVIKGEDLVGMYMGDAFEAWEKAAALSAQRNIRRVAQPFERVVSCAAPMYDELWTAAKAMYKLEPVVKPGGELIIYAPHLDTISRVHGRFIREIGYHCLAWFLEDFERFRHIPLGVLAHSTHVRGSGRMLAGVEKPDIQVTLASRIPEDECRSLNLGYQDPQKIVPAEWADREAEGILLVPRAGEVLYRLEEGN